MVHRGQKVAGSNPLGTKTNNTLITHPVCVKQQKTTTNQPIHKQLWKPKNTTTSPNNPQWCWSLVVVVALKPNEFGCPNRSLRSSNPFWWLLWILLHGNMETADSGNWGWIEFLVIWPHNYGDVMQNLEDLVKARDINVRRLLFKKNINWVIGCQDMTKKRKLCSRLRFFCFCLVFALSQVDLSKMIESRCVWLLLQRRICWTPRFRVSRYLSNITAQMLYPQYKKSPVWRRVHPSSSRKIHGCF